MDLLKHLISELMVPVSLPYMRNRLVFFIT